MPVRLVHVVVAVLGLGSILSIAIVAATARRTGRGSPEVMATLTTLLRYSSFSLAAMLATGVLMDMAAGGAMSRWWWFRGSAVLLVVTGILHGQARRTVRRGLGQRWARRPSFAGSSGSHSACSALIAAITVLMEVKPF